MFRFVVPSVFSSVLIDAGSRYDLPQLPIRYKINVMKRCPRCRTEKPESMFYRNRSKPDGLANYCKECERTYHAGPDYLDHARRKSKEYRQRDPAAYRERHREHAKKHRSEHQDMYRAIKERYMEQHRSELLDRNRSRYRAQREARNAVAAAIRGGLLSKPDICEVCGKHSERLEAHHDDYSMPLQVRWLCVECHGVTQRA